MFAGYFSTDSAGRGLAMPEALPDGFGPADCRGQFRGEGAWLLEQRRYNGKPSRDRQVPLVCPRSGTALVFWGRLDNRPQLIDRLGNPGATDAELVLAGWHRWQTELPHHLLGDFSLGLYSPCPRRLFLVRDPLGVKPLYYALPEAGLAFAASPAALRQIYAGAGLGLTPDPEWMARYLVRLSMSDRRTAYREMFKLPPGHSLLLEGQGSPQIQRYHHWRDDAPVARRRDPRWVEAYRAVLEEAIRCRMESDFPLGTENSGGLDSATVTAYLAHFLGVPGDRLHSFGFARCEQEPAFILETSQARGIGHNYIVTGPCHSDSDREDYGDRVLAVLGYPEEHGNGSGHIPFYRECQLRGIRTLFSGFGGDEVVTNPGQLLRYELLDQRNYRGLWDYLPSHPLRRGLSIAKAAVRGWPSPDYRPDLLRTWQARWQHQPLLPEVVNQFNLHREYLETARYDAPYRRINDFILKGLITQPYIPTRLENCTLMAASYGIEYRWPLWDVRLVQQYLSTPSLEKAGRGIGRYLHRRAVAGVVPQRVAWKPSKDMGYGTRSADSGEAAEATDDDLTEDLVNQLHPTLAPLVDQAKLQRQIARANQGEGDMTFLRSFYRTITALYVLDRWLRGAAP